ncbi:DUF1232 domain-containing protein [bacterium]|jgi:transcriptional regulator with XRE-family HTH domain|nr:DUF1232 domain-containing protein [bacterium]
MTIQTVGDLRTHLDNHGLSPEQFAKRVHLSHMTIRRWLKKGPEHKLPTKYLLLMNEHINSPSGSLAGKNPLGTPKNFADLIHQLEETGAAQVHESVRLESGVNEKLTEKGIDPFFKNYCGKLISNMNSSKIPSKSRALCAGALAYFINPFDVIPDAVPLIGYMDDLAVMGAVLNLLTDPLASTVKDTI